MSSLTLSFFMLTLNTGSVAHWFYLFTEEVPFVYIRFFFPLIMFKKMLYHLPCPLYKASFIRWSSVCQEDVVIEYTVFKSFPVFPCLDNLSRTYYSMYVLVPICH